MAKSSNQKMKLLYLYHILNDETNEENALTMAQIISRLEDVGISAERKSLYNDMELLRDFGLDIVSKRERQTKYFVASRDFELAELKLLVDAVQSSRFLTRKKSDSLIKKIEKLAGKPDASALQRQVFVANRIKNMNESIYYNIDYIHSAILKNKQISFKYFKWSVDFGSPQKIVKTYKKDEEYCVSPFALTWDDENYYLVAYDSVAGIIKHYRVDKMEKIKVTNIPREGEKIFSGFDLGEYSNKFFGMFGGEEQRVKIRFSNDLIGVVADRFGTDISIEKDGDDHFILRVNVAVSPQFFGWIFSFGNGAEIIYPNSVRVQMKEYLEKASLY